MGPVSWGSWIVSHQLGCPQAGPTLGLEERQVSMSGPNKAGTGVCPTSRVLEERHLHFPDKDTEMQRDEGS